MSSRARRGSGTSRSSARVLRVASRISGAFLIPWLLLPVLRLEAIHQLAHLEAQVRSFHPLLAEQPTERMFGHANFIGRNRRPPEDPDLPQRAVTGAATSARSPGRRISRRASCRGSPLYPAEGHRFIVASTCRAAPRDRRVPLGGDHLLPTGPGVARGMTRPEPTAAVVTVVELPLGSGLDEFVAGAHRTVPVATTGASRRRIAL